MTPRYLHWPKPLSAAIAGAGLFLILWGYAGWTPDGGTVATVVLPGHERTITEVRTVKRIVRGRVVHEQHKVYVLVPMIRVRTQTHWITVPAHRLRLKNANAAVAVAAEPVTVYITVPIDAAPIVVTSTVTETTTQIVPTTITLPLTGGDPAS